jgi:hypothetical protein
MKRRMGVVVAVALALPLISVSTAAADGEPAPGFGLNGVVIDNFVTAGYHLTSVEATQLTDGSFLVAGSLAGLIEISGTRHFLARFLANGQLDTSFGSGGVQRIAQRLSGLVPAPDGTALAILHINNEPDSPTMSVSMPRFGGIGPLGLGLATQLIVRPDGAVFEVMEPSAVNPVIVWIVRPGSDSTELPFFRQVALWEATIGRRDQRQPCSPTGGWSWHSLTRRGHRIRPTAASPPSCLTVALTVRSAPTGSTL